MSEITTRRSQTKLKCSKAPNLIFDEEKMGGGRATTHFVMPKFITVQKEKKYALRKLDLTFFYKILNCINLIALVSSKM